MTINLCLMSIKLALGSERWHFLRVIQARAVQSKLNSTSLFFGKEEVLSSDCEAVCRKWFAPIKPCPSGMTWWFRSKKQVQGECILYSLLLIGAFLLFFFNQKRTCDSRARTRMTCVKDTKELSSEVAAYSLENVAGSPLLVRTAESLNRLSALDRLNDSFPGLHFTVGDYWFCFGCSRCYGHYK